MENHPGRTGLTREPEVPATRFREKPPRLDPQKSKSGIVALFSASLGIPSTQEVAEHGINVGEMQAKLLAKIEELTLHVIAAKTA